MQPLPFIQLDTRIFRTDDISLVQRVGNEVHIFLKSENAHDGEDTQPYKYEGDEAYVVWNFFLNYAFPVIPEKED